MDVLRPYLEVILNERNWSWTLLSLLYLLAGLMIRGWFINPFVARAKELERHYWQEIKKNYLKHSLLGWCFFTVPLITLGILWYLKGAEPLTVSDFSVLFLALLCYILSILFHLQAFGIATVRTLKRSIEVEKEKKIF